MGEQRSADGAVPPPGQRTLFAVTDHDQIRADFVGHSADLLGGVARAEARLDGEAYSSEEGRLVSEKSW